MAGASLWRFVKVPLRDPARDIAGRSITLDNVERVLIELLISYYHAGRAA